MKRLGRLATAVALLATLGLASACQRMVDVQSGTRVVDSQGRVISEDIKTLHVSQDAAGAYRINTITRDDTATPQVATFYADAQIAIALGDLKLAQTKLAEVIAIAPGYRNAQQQSDAIKAGKKVTPDATPPKSAPSKPTPTPPSSPTPPETASSLLSWTPDALSGFTAAKAAVDPLSVSREYIPGSGNAAKTFVIAVEQFRTPTDAKAALDVNVRQRYPKSASSSTVHGHDVYFGTDGHRFAALGFTSGSAMIALEASPDSGSPAAMKGILESALGQLP